MTKIQRKATLFGRLAGFAATLYFWFILNNYSDISTTHQSLFAAMLEEKAVDTPEALAIVVLSLLVVSIITGFIARVFFSVFEK